MKRPSMSGSYLLGRDSHVWEEPVEGDLIALKPRHTNDVFSSWVATKFIRSYHQTVGRYFKISFLLHYQRKVRAY